MRRSSKTFYFPSGMLEEIECEAARLGRSPSTLLVEAWRLARTRILSLPPDIKDGDDTGDAFDDVSSE